ncbi:MAG: M20/M25/M40 family metallo-hydrolase [Bacteroidetes bacterium]|jgi:leucyl aminopeptidase|nr:M20/M25/M40 family metallo-hydrolase [Bacteroidota bacterium]
MNQKTLLLIIAVFLSYNLWAQNKEIIATMDSQTAAHYKNSHPSEIDIVKTSNGISAVLLTEKMTQILRMESPVHGPQFMVAKSLQEASAVLNFSPKENQVQNFTITEPGLVYDFLDAVSQTHIENTILDLQNYGTRYHTKSQATQSVLDLKQKWDTMILASSRTDISTRLVTHAGSPMPSLILTIEGNSEPSEYVIIGGHIDSISWNNDDAPGADDNASGIASLTEIVRVLLENKYQPSKTVEVMAYAAEEIGLVGSAEIAADYKSNNVNVVSYLQLDMTGYNGSVEDVYILDDWYSSSALNQFLASLMDTYNSSGAHQFTYGFSQCGYACSDHASWALNGYPASMPFEAKLGEDNPFIHTPDDLFSVIQNGEHAVKFTKLGLQYIVEAAKGQKLNTSDFIQDKLTIYQRNHMLFYRFSGDDAIETIAMYDMNGRKIRTFGSVQEGFISIENIQQGIYVVVFNTITSQQLMKKILIY